MNFHIEYYLCLLASTLMWIGMKVKNLLITKYIETLTNPEDKFPILKTILQKFKLLKQTVAYKKQVENKMLILRKE